MRPFPTIDDQVGQFLDTLLKRQAHRPEPLTVATVMGAANLLDHQEERMSDRNRKAAKSAAVLARLEEIHPSRELLIGMLDEHKLDLLILALGIGDVQIKEA